VKAVVYDTYGPPDVLRLEEVARPAPKLDEVLIRVHATTVNRTDCGLRAGEPFVSRLISGFPRPRWRILGTELAGTVEAAGAAVTQFAAGDEVFGVNAWRFGAHAEFVCMRERGPLAPKPAGMSFEEAAAVCDGAALALGCLRAASVRPGRSVLIYGASGSIGTAAVQLARYLGADVTAVCSTENLELVRSLGADCVIDYTRADFTQNGEAYDVVFDAVGMQPFGGCRDSIRPGGAYLATDHLHNLALVLWTSMIGNRKVLFPIPPKYTKEDVLFLKQLIEDGHYRAVVDRRYLLDDVVDATAYVETKQKTGNVVLTVANESDI
jgi:NADPH:quinone reductase-like Zn-dependent oxidoreductase